MFEVVSCLLHTPFQNAGGLRGRGGTWWGCPAVPHSRCQAGPGSWPFPAPGRSGPEGVRMTSGRRPAPACSTRRDESSGGTVSAQAGPGLGRVFFHQVALFLPKWIFNSNCLFLLSQGKHHFQLHFSGFPFKNEKQMLFLAGKMWKNV